VEHKTYSKYHSRTQNIEPKKGIVGAVGRRCVYFGVRWGWGKGSGYRYRITTCACLVAVGAVGLLSVL